MLPHLTYMECYKCKNFFFVYEYTNIPEHISQPKYCPYCGTKFEYELQV
jgi:ribosomal protein L33